MMSRHPDTCALRFASSPMLKNITIFQSQTSFHQNVLFADFSLVLYILSFFSSHLPLLGSSFVFLQGTLVIMLRVSRFHRSSSHFLVTFVVAQKSRLSPTKNSLVIVMTSRHTLSSQMQVGFPRMTPTRILFHKGPSANIIPALLLSCFCDFFCLLPALADL